MTTSPTLFEQWCGFFCVRQEPDKWACCETGHTVFLPYPRYLFYQLKYWKNNVLSLIFPPAEWMLYSSVLRKWLSSLWTKSYGMTIQKNPLPQYFHVVLFVIQHFPKLNLEFNLCLTFILITSGSKRVRLNEMDNPTGRNCTPYRDWKIAKEHQTPEFWVSVKEAPLGGVLISRIPVIFWPNIPYPINSGHKYPGN